jgi:hypothetical protein
MGICILTQNTPYSKLDARWVSARVVKNTTRMETRAVTPPGSFLRILDY